ERRRLDEDRVAERVLDGVAESNRVVPRNGDAAVAHDLLEEILVHRERRRRDACADVGDVRELEQPLHRAVLAERAVEDREDDVDSAERPHRAVARWDRQRLGRKSWVRPLSEGPGPGFEGPPSVAADRHRDHVVAVGVERLEHGPGRGEGDLVLARAPAREQRDADAPAHGVCAVVVAAVVVWPVESRPTVSVIDVFDGTCWPPCGVWSSTTPSEFGSVVSW